MTNDEASILASALSTFVLAMRKQQPGRVKDKDVLEAISLTERLAQTLRERTDSLPEDAVAIALRLMEEYVHQLESPAMQ